MQPVYLGTLSADDPLHHFLVTRVFNQVLGVTLPTPTFEVHRLDHHGVVCRYTDQTTAMSVIGKFFRRKTTLNGGTFAATRSHSLLENEWAALHQARGLGLDSAPYRVVRPLAMERSLDAVLIEEFVVGIDLGTLIHDAIFAGQTTILALSLTTLSGLFAALHGRSQINGPVDDYWAMVYLDKVLAHLSQHKIVSQFNSERIQVEQAQWHASGILRQASRCLIHGDATPANILFASPHEATAIDLERLRYDDAAVDIGYLVAELKHWFFRWTDDPTAGEWTIQHVYRSYAAHRQFAPREVRDFTRRGQFYMGCAMLRISRNQWLDREYRQRLTAEAQQCLQF